MAQDHAGLIRGLGACSKLEDAVRLGVCLVGRVTDDGEATVALTRQHEVRTLRACAGVDVRHIAEVSRLCLSVSRACTEQNKARDSGTGCG